MKVVYWPRELQSRSYCGVCGKRKMMVAGDVECGPICRECAEAADENQEVRV